VDELVRNISIPVPAKSGMAGGGARATYTDLCARWGRDCFFSDTVKLNNVVDAVEAGRVNLTFPVYFDETSFDYIILPISMGEPVLDGDVVKSAPAVGLFFILKAGTDEEINM
jgi:hypothetical protein